MKLHRCRAVAGCTLENKSPAFSPGELVLVSGSTTVCPTTWQVKSSNSAMYASKEKPGASLQQAMTSATNLPQQSSEGSMLHPMPTSAPIPTQRKTLPFLWQKALSDSIGSALQSCAGFATPVKFVGRGVIVIVVVVEVVV